MAETIKFVPPEINQKEIIEFGENEKLNEVMIEKDITYEAYA